MRLLSLISRNSDSNRCLQNYSGVLDFAKKAPTTPIPKEVLEIIKWEKREWSAAIFGSGLLFFYLTSLGGYTYLALASVLLIIHIIVRCCPSSRNNSFPWVLGSLRHLSLQVTIYTARNSVGFNIYTSYSAGNEKIDTTRCAC